MYIKYWIHTSNRTPESGVLCEVCVNGSALCIEHCAIHMANPLECKILDIKSCVSVLTKLSSMHHSPRSTWEREDYEMAMRWRDLPYWHRITSTMRKNKNNSTKSNKLEEVVPVFCLKHTSRAVILILVGTSLTSRTSIVKFSTICNGGEPLSNDRIVMVCTHPHKWHFIDQ